MMKLRNFLAHFTAIYCKKDSRTHHASSLLDENLDSHIQDNLRNDWVMVGKDIEATLEKFEIKYGKK